jgi:MFS family permease
MAGSEVPGRLLLPHPRRMAAPDREPWRGREHGLAERAAQLQAPPVAVPHGEQGSDHRDDPPARPGGKRAPAIGLAAGVATIAAFAASGLFAALSGLILATTLHQTSHALVGAALFLVFTAGVVSQLATTRLQAPRVLALGTISMIAGLVLLVIAVRLPSPSLALFLIGGALIGPGAGAVYKGTTGIVLEATAPENRVGMTSALVIAVFVGLSVPVIGAGIALDQGASVPNTVLGFAILVALGVSVSGWALLGRRPAGSRRTAQPTATASKELSP